MKRSEFIENVADFMRFELERISREQEAKEAE